VFLTTHYLEEADRYAERVMVMDRGRVIADDTAPRLKAELAGDVLTLGLASESDAERAVAVIRSLTEREVRREAGATVTVTAPDGDALLPAAVRALDAAGIGVVRATGVPPTLDDVFLALTGRTLREAGEGEPAPETEESDDARGAASVTTGAQR
jgi:ABC-2 type transport system ATP-binding protein